MKDINLFRKEVLIKTLSLVDEPFENWRTHNDQINTVLFLENSDFDIQIELFPDELPLLECTLEDSNVLITTNRVISIIGADTQEMRIKDIDKFGNEFERENFNPIDGKPPKTNLVALYDSNGDRLVFKIDSLYPAYFAKILIHNLISYRNKGAFDWEAESDPKIE